MTLKIAARSAAHGTTPKGAGQEHDGRIAIQRLPVIAGIGAQRHRNPYFETHMNNGPPCFPGPFGTTELRLVSVGSILPVTYLFAGNGV